MKIFINGTGNISPQKTFDKTKFLQDIVIHDQKYLKCVEPDYREIIPKGKLPRRLGRSLKIGITSAILALKDAGIENPDAIITGTGMGMLADTEKFLTTMIDNEEKFLNPTSFIQSTHNTIGAYIAVMLGCNKYNFSYVHGSLAFENALLNALIMLKENPSDNVLVGGIDEMTEQHCQIKTINHKYKNELVDQSKILESHTPGAVPGEGSVFFTLGSTQSNNAYATIEGLETHYKPDNAKQLNEKIISFLDTNQLTPETLDMVILGINGDNRTNAAYKILQDGVFKNTNQAYYKHLCGEYPTSIAFAIWLAASILTNETVPDVIKIRNNSYNTTPKNVLIYNQDRNINHSLILLSGI